MINHVFIYSNTVIMEKKNSKIKQETLWQRATKLSLKATPHCRLHVHVVPEVTRRISSPPPGWDASLSQGYPQHWICWLTFVHLDIGRHCESQVSCPRTQQNAPPSGLQPWPFDLETGTLTIRQPRPLVYCIPSSYFSFGNPYFSKLCNNSY